MNNKWASQPSSPSGQSAPPQKQFMVTQGENGMLQLAQVSQRAMTALQNTPQPQRTQRVQQYLRGVFSPQEQAPEQIQLRRFMSWYERYQCFHCLDSGMVKLPHQTPIGTYEMVYQCHCQASLPHPIGGSNLPSVETLVQKGYYQPFCQLGGPDGQACPLPKAGDKCAAFRCTKFNS